MSPITNLQGGRVARTFENLPTIGEAFATGRNSFDLLRLFASVVVLYEHSYVLSLIHI